jgi:hypothetical protein
MTMKKIPVYITVFMLGALVLSGCSNLFFEKPRQDPGGETASPDIPEGFGTVQVSLTQGAARTSIPAADLAGLYLEYWFPKDGGTAEARTPVGNIFTLKPGSYILEVKVFVDGEHVDLAAQGETDTAFTITAGVAAEPVNMTLRPVVTGTGTGELEYPVGTAVETFTLTHIAGVETPIDLAVAGTGPGSVNFSGTEAAIPVGYYLLRVALKNSTGASSGRVEVVHIYQNLKSEVHYVFIGDDFRAYRVTNANDSGPGSLRQALADVKSGDIIEINEGLVITLTSQLFISRAINLTIEGSGATLTQTGTNRLLNINSTSADVTIRRMHFKDGNYTSYSDGGGAICNSGTLTLESCIFSGNKITSSSARGGAIYTALGMKTSSSSRNKNIGEQLKVLRNKGGRFFLILPLRS